MVKPVFNNEPDAPAAIASRSEHAGDGQRPFEHPNSRGPDVGGAQTPSDGLAMAASPVGEDRPQPDQVIAMLGRIGRSARFAEGDLVIEVVTVGVQQKHRRVYRSISAAQAAVRRAEERGVEVSAHVWALRPVGGAA